VVRDRPATRIVQIAMVLMPGNRMAREGAKIKTDCLIHLLEDLVSQLRIGVVAKILRLATTSHPHSEWHQYHIAPGSCRRALDGVASRGKQRLTHAVRLAPKTFSHGVGWRSWRGFFDGMMRRKIDDRP